MKINPIKLTYEFLRVVKELILLNLHYFFQLFQETLFILNFNFLDLKINLIFLTESIRFSRFYPLIS